MRKKVLGPVLWVISVLFLGSPETKEEKRASEHKDVHQMLNLLWLGNDHSVQQEKENILRTFDFSTQG